MRVVPAPSATAPWAVLRVHGELDLASAPELRSAVLRALERGERWLAIDLTDVDFCDSTALGVLLGSLRRARQAGGDLRVIGPGPGLAAVLTLVELAPVFRPVPTVDALDVPTGWARR